MARRPEIGAIQLYPNRPLRPRDKNGYVLKFYCPIQRKRIRRNCGTRDRREARRILNECRKRLLDGDYVASGGAITAADVKIVSSAAITTNAGLSWQEACDRYRAKFKGRSIADVTSRLSLAERIFEKRRAKQGLPPGMTVQECFTDEAIEYFQDRLLAGEESRYASRSSMTVRSIVKTVMTFARYCKRKKWIAQVPEVEKIGDGEEEDPMKGRPITGEEFDRMLAAVTKVVGEGPTASWRFTLRVFWESAFRVADVMDFSWDDPRHICPKWPNRPGQHPTLVIPKTQKNGKKQEIPMLPGLAELLKQVPEEQRTGWVVNPLPIEYEMHCQHTGWFMPDRSDLDILAKGYNNSAIARACGVSDTTVRKWLVKAGISRHGRVRSGAEIPPDEVAALQARAARRLTHQVQRSTGRLTKERVSRIISMMGKKANIVVRQSDKENGRRVKYASAHDLRRGCAARLINAGVSAESLQVIMRHKDFATTQKFYSGTKAAQAAAAEAYEKLGAKCTADELVGGKTLPPTVTAEQQKKLKALLESL